MVSRTGRDSGPPTEAKFPSPCCLLNPPPVDEFGDDNVGLTGHKGGLLVSEQYAQPGAASLFENGPDHPGIVRTEVIAHNESGRIPRVPESKGQLDISSNAGKVMGRIYVNHVGGYPARLQ